MTIKKMPAALGGVVVLMSVAVESRYGVEQGPVAVAPADETPGGNTPWT
ncbi:hypothetical protein QOM21_31925 [Streptomyces sp. Pv4-95]